MVLSMVSALMTACAEKAETVVDSAGDIKQEIESALPEFSDEFTEALSDTKDEVISAAAKATTQITKELEKTGSLEEVSLVRVVDGDTLVVIAEDGLEYKVRLIGIDTPESVHVDKTKNNDFGKAASDHTKEILADTDTLYLEYDKEITDKYNRTLAYVWFTPETSDIENMLNARILKEGYAIDKVFEPNHKYAKDFKAICDKANNESAGLWSADGYRELTGR